MVNPDGVILGNYRSNLAGFDLNRQFKNNIQTSIFPELIAYFDLMKHIKSLFKENILAFIDLHGHSI